jgi:glycosyltransferase involved in cell wall biosynthesis
MKMSCVVPARNEEGHLREVITQILLIESISDIVIIEGGSIDNTYDLAHQITCENPDRIQLLKQVGLGKFDAVMMGAKYAKEEFLIIWDSDGTVPVDSTLKVILATQLSGKMSMGNRLVGKIENGAMQFFNLIGNWLFAIAWSPLLGNKSLDLLCGTKIVPTKLFRHIPNWLTRVDPYGDFALIATAIANGIKINSVPVDYLKRSYGGTNIHRWTGGVRLLLTTFCVYIWILYRFFKK